MTGLKISGSLTLPMEAVTETFVILAKRGTGKTYTASVMAEEIIGAGHPCVVVDPIGVWWGLRSSADGQSAGLPIVIFGGDHGDVPLDEKSGEIIADAIVAERFSAVLDLSLLSKSASKRFMAAFIARLYHRNRDPLHIIVDEADAFAPQRTAGDGAVLLGAMEDLVRRGRARGIGCTLITQRPAVLNKDVLTQAEVLICLRMNGVRDVQAIDEWVRLHADEDEARELKKSLPSLPIGTAWIWSPGWLGLLEKVQIRTRATFDSSATPKVGQKRIVPKQMADIDIEALGAKITATAEEAKANDPKALKAEVRRLRAELEKETPAPEPIVERVEVPALTKDDRWQLGELKGELSVVKVELERVEKVLDRIADTLHSAPSEVAVPRLGQINHASYGNQWRTGPPVVPKAPPRTRAVPSDDSQLTGPMRRVLDAIAWLEAVGFPQPTKIQTGFIAGYRAGKKIGGAYGNILGALRAQGLIEYPTPGTVELTADGRALAAPADIEQSTEGLQAAIYDRLTKPEQRILEGIVAAYPESLTKQDAGAQAGYTVGAKVGGAYGNMLGRLRSLGLIDYPSPGLVAATEVLFMDGAL